MLWHEAGHQPEYSQVVELDLGDVEPSLAGPRRPQDRVPLARAKDAFLESLGTFGVDLVNGTYDKEIADSFPASDPPTSDGVRPEEEAAPVATVTLDDRRVPVEGSDYTLEHGSVVIAAITSCTNTSNPSVMIAAGLLAKKAVERGLERRPWVKSSLAPGSKVVSEYYRAAGLDEYLDELGFNTVGYGCTTCIGNSGPLPEPISAAVAEGDLVVCAVLSGNRNFEARIHGEVKANYLASPPLVVAYALAGSVMVDLATDPIGTDQDGNAVYLKDIWPSSTAARTSSCTTSGRAATRSTR
jgi:aconitate hydratase